MSMAATWHRLRVGPSDMYLTRKASFKDTLFIGMQQGKPPSLCSRVVFLAVLSLDVNTQTVFLFYMSIKYTLRGCFRFLCPCWLLCQQMKSIRFFNPPSVTYMRAQLNSNTPANIYGLIQTFKYQYWGFQVYLGVYFEDPNRYLIKMFTLHNGLHNKLGLYIFHIFTCFAFGIYWLFIVPNLKSRHAVFAMLWSFQWMLVPRFWTGWSVAKLFCECMPCYMIYEMFPCVYGIIPYVIYLVIYHSDGCTFEINLPHILFKCSWVNFHLLLKQMHKRVFVAWLEL